MQYAAQAARIVRAYMELVGSLGTLLASFTQDLALDGSARGMYAERLRRLRAFLDTEWPQYGARPPERQLSRQERAKVEADLRRLGDFYEILAVRSPACSCFGCLVACVRARV